ncbi:hypothetical protein MU582_08975 [Nocardioidaceae bacterium SCSIO 66511]|nr:hypothetical protein MU582_08975 [Nocardioidaceae bacterium SCSIO 66511]
MTGTNDARSSSWVRARRLAGRVRRRLRRRRHDELGALRESVESLQRRLDDLDVAERFDRQHHRIGVLEREVVRIGTQVAAIEVRLEDRRQAARPIEVGDGDTEALAVLAEVRREHQRVRARISAAARYEERLRQVEEQLNALDAAALSEK